MSALQKILFFCFCFVLVFGPKVGYFDIALIAPFLLFNPFVGINRKIRKPFVVIICFLILIFVDQAVVQLFNGNMEIDVLGRLFKNIILAFFVAVVFGQENLGCVQLKIKILFYSILAHSLIVIVSAHLPALNAFLSLVSGNERFRELRSSGLLAGYDIAGTVSNVALILLFLGVVRFKSVLFTIAVGFVILVSTYYSSRISLAIGLFLFASLVFTLVKNVNISRSSRFFIFFLSLGLVSYVAYEFIVVLEATIGLGVLDISTEVAANISLRNAVVNDDIFWIDMFHLPKSYFQITFGTGSETLDSDVGYVKEIYRYGILGLLLSISSYISFVFLCVKNAPGNFRENRLKVAFVAIVFLGFLLTFKNNYLFVRGFFPIVLIIGGCLLVKKKVDFTRSVPTRT